MIRYANITISSLEQFDLADIVNNDERILWTGAPEYGTFFLQSVGDERKLHIFLFIGAVLMWSSLPLIGTEGGLDREVAVWVFGAITFAFFGCSIFLASQRQFVLRNLAYFVTDKRVIICRRGRNWSFDTRLYVISRPHSKTFPYEVISSHPYPKLQVGTFLSQDQVQPLGLGLSHPGHPFLWGRINYPVTLDYLSNASALHDTIQSCAHAN